MRINYGKQQWILNTVILNRIELDEAMEADMIFDVLMGEKVEPRREFIQENAKYVTDLDI